MNEDKAMSAYLIHGIGVLPFLYTGTARDVTKCRQTNVRHAWQCNPGKNGSLKRSLYRFPENAENWLRQQDAKFAYMWMLSFLHSRTASLVNVVRKVCLLRYLRYLLFTGMAFIYWVQMPAWS